MKVTQTMQDLVEQKVDGFLSITLCSGQRELVSYASIEAVHDRRPTKGTAIRLHSGRCIMLSVPAERVIALIEKGAANGAS